MTILWIIALVIVIVSAVTTAWAAWRAAPYVPTRSSDVKRMLDLAQVKDGETVYDLGAGDGRLLLAAAERGSNVRAVGYELSLPVWLIAWLRLRFSPAAKRLTIHCQDFFRHNLSAADVVVCFLTPEAMRKLGPKFKRELKPGARVVSAVFPIADWTPAVKDKPSPGVVSIYLYRV